MNLDFFVVMSNLVSLFSLIAVGYLAAKLRVIDSSASHYFTAILMKVTLPCTIFISLVQKEYDPDFIIDSIIIFTAGIILFIVILYLSRFIAILMRVPKDSRGIWAFMCTFPNSGFMGFPIVLTLLGPEALALAVMLNNISFTTIGYTLGAMEVARDNSANKSGNLGIKGIIFTGINFALILSLIFYFGRIPLPEIIASPINYLSALTTPLSMMIIGMALSHSRGVDIFRNIHILTCTLMRLIVFPVILCVVFSFVPLSTNPMVRTDYY